jgi:uncharacterized membrane protein YagU involved in acid resistance
MRLTIARGVITGLVGTAVMSVAFLSMEKAGMVPGKLEPKEIADNFEEKIGVRDYLPKPAFEASWIMLHLGYGTFSGVVYTLALKMAPNLGSLVVQGPSLGIILWAFGYCGWLPLLGLYPLPTHVPKRKVGANILAHMVYGTAAVVTRRVLKDD